MVKTDPERVKTVIYISLQLTANLAIAFEPFLPFSSEKLRKMLNMESFEWNRLGRTDLLQAGHRLAKPELLVREDRRRRNRSAGTEVAGHEESQ